MSCNKGDAPKEVRSAPISDGALNGWEAKLDGEIGGKIDRLKHGHVGHGWQNTGTFILNAFPVMKLLPSMVLGTVMTKSPKMAVGAVANWTFQVKLVQCSAWSSSILGN